MLHEWLECLRRDQFQANHFPEIRLDPFLVFADSLEEDEEKGVDDLENKYCRNEDCGILKKECQRTVTYRLFSVAEFGVSCFKITLARASSKRHRFTTARMDLVIGWSKGSLQKWKHLKH